MVNTYIHTYIHTYIQRQELERKQQQLQFQQQQIALKLQQLQNHLPGQETPPQQRIESKIEELKLIEPKVMKIALRKRYLLLLTVVHTLVLF